MRRFLAIVITATLFLSCAGTLSVADAAAQLRQATEHYAHLVATMDGAGIAALYTADGESVVVGQPPVRGRRAIQTQLESFRGFSVQSEVLTADTVTTDGRRGHVIGSYRQRVRVPAGEVVEVHGAYAADWLREGSHWHIQRLVTTPQ